MNNNKSNILVPFDATELSIKALDKARESCSKPEFYHNRYVCN